MKRSMFAMAGQSMGQKGLVNAILRKASSSETKPENIEEDLPVWLSKKLEADFPDHYQMIKKAFLIKTRNGPSN